MKETFLTRDEITQLTGRTRGKLQIEQLRKQGIAFWLNAAGLPVVPRSAIEHNAPPVMQEKTWQPSV